MKHNNAVLKYACYTANITMSAVANLSPLLFLTFRSLYDISYSLLGLLVLINFCTQLCVDLIFSIFPQKFNIQKTVRMMPMLSILGLFIYAVVPFFTTQFVYLGLVVGTVVFSASAGLAEVLISPVFAEIPSENPDREMSKLHSSYAWGVVGVVIFSTIFLFVFGNQNWQWLALLLMVLPLISFVLFARADVPHLATPEAGHGIWQLIRRPDFLIVFFCIMLGGAAECTMAQWSSGYIEKALQIPKVFGDIFGVALFAAMLGLGRSMYAKFGKNIYNILIIGAFGASICYVVAAVSNIAIIGLLACALTGLCTSMLWPGSIVIASEKFPAAGVTIFALMAAGGDLGASIGPQLVGSIIDSVSANQSITAFATQMALTNEQLGMKIGLLISAIFPLLCCLLVAIARKRNKAQ